MATLGDGEWRAVRAAYEGRGETLAEIGRRFGIQAGAISQRAARHGWKRRRARANTSTPGDEKQRDVLQQTMLARLYRLVSLKLDHLEEAMSRSDERTPTDNERETRAIGTMVRNLEKVVGLDQSVRSGADDDGKRRGAENDVDSEDVRRELAERLARLRERKRADAGDGAGADG